MPLAKLKPDVKEKWLEALESGKYQQGQNRLRSVGNKFCCLGVLCDVLHPDGWGTASGSWVFDRSYQFDLPVALADDAGASAKAQHKLMNMNDNGRSFKQIAAYIRRYL
jgi:hypothetical protein